VVADGDRLSALLRRVRRRVRAQIALQGGIVGALAALAGADLWLLMDAAWRGDLTEAARPWVAGLALAPLAGAIWFLRRRPVSLASAARLVDRASCLEGGQRSDDRVFVALFVHGSELAQAAIRDAVRRTAATPVARVAPWRRPSGLGLLGMFATLAIGLVVWPWQSAAQSRPSSGARAERSSAQVQDERARREARAELDRLLRAAALLGDAELMALIAQADRLLATEAAGAVEGRELIRQLAAMAAVARSSAQASAALADAFNRVAQILSTVPETQAWAEALSRLEARASEREAQAAGNRMQQGGAAERSALARALERAAAAAQAAAEERQRRLSGLEDSPEASRKEPDPVNPPPPASAPDRSLKRLERDLRDSAESCERDPEACAKALKQAAESLGSEMGQARSAAERNQLARTLEQELARQAEAGAGGRGEQAPGLASGEPNAGGQGREGERPAGEAVAASKVSGAAGSADGTGAGIGDQPGTGGDPGPGQALGGLGEKREVQLNTRAGPSRSQVIEGGARRGAAQPGYRRVYREYEAAVEEALDATSVPPGRRRLVRRYFELIHPR
jgi:hypothetical protein